MKPQAPDRSAYRHFRPITTRWADNDIYGHINNVEYYAFFDTAVNGYLVEAGALALDPVDTGPIGLVVATSCDYFASLAFPDEIEGAIRVERLGTSSVTYGVGIFRERDNLAAAAGRFTHVYVNRETRRPVTLPDRLRQALEPLHS